MIRRFHLCLIAIDSALSRLSQKRLSILLCDPFRCLHVGHCYAAYRSHSFPVFSTITSSSASRTLVDMLVVDNNNVGRWMSVSFAFKLEKPSVIGSTDRTVLQLYVFRNDGVNKSPYRLTVEAYDEYFRFGDESTKLGASGEFNCNFSYDTWYTVHFTRTGNDDSTPQWTMSYGVGRGVEASTAVTYGQTNATYSNNYNIAYNSSHGLRFTASSDAEFVFSIDNVTLQHRSYRTIVFDCHSTDASQHVTASGSTAVSLTDSCTLVSSGTLTVDHD